MELVAIATSVKNRKQGWGSRLTLEVSEQLESENGAQAIFLFADIDPKFYERLGFVILPDDFQEYKTSTCMVKLSGLTNIWDDSSFQPPKYF